MDTCDFGCEIYDRNGKLMRLTTASDERYRSFVSFNQISKHLVDATLLYEDRYFWQHPGVNVVALMAAAVDTYVGGNQRGASTITMQLARMKYGIDSRTPLGKLHQILWAFRLEMHYTKEEILEAYFNLAPYGGNVEGIKAASLIYFGKSPQNLTQSEAILLATIPQNPAKRKPGPLGKETDSLYDARQRLGAIWLTEHPNVERHALGLRHRFTLGLPLQLPFFAPHTTVRLLAKHRGARRLDTTLLLEIQKELEERIGTYVEKHRLAGIHNAAAMVLDHRNNHVVALVGSADFFNANIDGQVNGTTARRSPGSALKPFVYGLAMDEGLIHPASLLKDSPVSFSDYTPGNFDKQFRGPISATEALVRSRNIPAVRLASQLSDGGLYQLLQKAGVKKLRDENTYGLPIVLGGVEVSMEELASLYSALKNDGVVTDVVYEKPRATAERLRVRIMSPEAAFLNTEMLSVHGRPGQRFNDAWTRDSFPVAWKTGTSPGMRDAWSVGIVGQYVVVVWVGQFMGGQSPAYVGKRSAAPLFFEIVDSLRARGLQPPVHLDKQLNVTRVEVCATSGALPGPHCPHTRETWFIPGKSPIQRCAIHQQIEVDTRTGQRVCPEKAGSGQKQVVELWPSDMRQLFKEAGLPRTPPPQFPSSCALSASEPELASLKITSPKNRLVYAVRSDSHEEEKVPFTAQSSGDANVLFWFVNGAPIGRAAPGETLFWPPRPGTFQVAVLDDQGRSDSLTVHIEMVK
ncbi:MAG: penicillin-binding protein 1C [Deltaproteobacteria bacterium]|nr:penicillin-binding protein 1C [Deltaproteobacteria bacterium]